MRWSTTADNRGFTLLELLVAMALLVVISAAVYGTYFSVLRGSESALQVMERQRAVGTTLDLLRRELESVDWNRGNPRLRFVVEDRDVYGKPASLLEFTTLSGVEGVTGPASGMIEAIYQIREKGDRLQLIRGARDPYLEAKDIPYLQMEDLEGFLVECYNGDKWLRTWDASQAAGLPKAVRITVRLRDGDGTVEYSTTALSRIEE